MTDDRWFSSTNEMVDFLKDEFKEDDTKEYYLVDDEETACLRLIEREERTIVGCMSCHVKAFMPNGLSIKKWPNIRDYLENSEIENDDSQIENNEVTEEPDDITWVESLDHLDMFDLIEIGSFVAIRAHSISIEQFHLMKVTDKKIASSNITHKSKEHNILKDEPFVIGKWFLFQFESRKNAQYKEAKNIEDALIHIGEIISTNIELNSKNQLDIAEYRMLSCTF